MNELYLVGARRVVVVVIVVGRCVRDSRGRGQDRHKRRRSPVDTLVALHFDIRGVQEQHTHEAVFSCTLCYLLW